MSARSRQAGRTEEHRQIERHIHRRKTLMPKIETLQQLQDWIDCAPNKEEFAVIAIYELLRRLSIPQLSLLSSKIVTVAAEKVEKLKAILAEVDE